MNFVYFKQFEQNAGPDNIDNRIDRADFMKMNRLAVFRFPEYKLSFRPDRLPPIGDPKE